MGEFDKEPVLRDFSVTSRNSFSADGSRVELADFSDETREPRDHISVEQPVPKDSLSILRAVVFLEDAINYRSIFHKTDRLSLIVLRVYRSRLVQWTIHSVIFILHVLAFFESPSSFSATADIRQHAPRTEFPCGAILGVELVCLLLLLGDCIVKSYLLGWKRVLREKWIVAFFVIITLSVADWSVSAASLCDERIRVRRLFRPFFLLQNSSVMKKAVNCIRRSLPDVFSVLLLLLFHIYLFAMLGMLLFQPMEEKPGGDFGTLKNAVLNLLVLLTTANNPDIMMPAYSTNRLYFIYFALFLVVGLFCFMNMLAAVIYNQFRGYFLKSLQASLFRRRIGVRAAFEMLQSNNNVSVQSILLLVEAASMSRSSRSSLKEALDGRAVEMAAPEFQQLMDHLDKDASPPPLRPKQPRHRVLRVLQRIVSHPRFVFFGSFVAFANVLCITIEVSRSAGQQIGGDSVLASINLAFTVYYIFEQSLRVWALGFKAFARDWGNILDAVVTLLLAVGEGLFIVQNGISFGGPRPPHTFTWWDVVRIINILILFRLIRLLRHIPTMALVAGTLIDLFRNLRAFLGVLAVIYYAFGIFGMQLFQGVITYPPTDNGTSYHQLKYYANNFDDFGASLVVLFDLMVVNNWHVFLQMYAQVTSEWSNLFFVAWWLFSVVMGINLFTAIILEMFIMKWDNKQQQANNFSAFVPHSVHELFRQQLHEPAEDELISELRKHQYLSFSDHSENGGVAASENQSERLGVH